MAYSYRVFLLLAIVFIFTAPLFAKYGGGMGDPNDPYQIATVDHLFEMRDNSADWCKCFIMMENIDLNGYEFSEAIISPDISSSQNDYVGIPFTGAFDGNHKIIKNMNIKGNSYLGFFGKIENCVIENLIIIESSVHAVEGSRNCGGITGMNNRGKIIHCSFSGDVVGYWNVSGICGINLYGLITDCYSEGSVSICDTQYNAENALGGLVGNNSEGCILRCNSTCSVSGQKAVGGLVGKNYKGIISSCYATGDVDGSSYAGGLIGINDEGRASDCFSSGSVSGTSEGIGGFIGLHDNGGTIINCFSSGSVVGSQEVGGLIGKNHLSGIFNCYSNGQAVGQGSNQLYGLIGDGCPYGLVIDSFWEIYSSDRIVSGGGTAKTKEQMQNIDTFLDAGWDFQGEKINGISNMWCMNPEDGYPTLAALHGFPPNILSGEGTETHPYLIYDANDLATVWYRPEASYYLKNNINLAGMSWNASVISEYSGETFDGNQYKILNMKIDNSKSRVLGLFAYIHLNSKIKNLCIENCTIKGDTSVGLAMINYGYIEGCYVIGDLYANSAGGLIGINKGEINNCHTSVNIEIYTGAAGLIIYNQGGFVNDCSSTGFITSPDSKASGRMGGLIAYSKGGEVNNSHSTIEIEGANRSNNVGGLVGTSEYCTIHNCFATGRMKGKNSVGGLVGGSRYSTVMDSHSIGNVNGSYYVGGLIGTAGSGTIITNCYAHGDVSSSGTAGGLVGQSSSRINNCFAKGSVEGSSLVGGLIGWNKGSIVNSYSIGNVNALGRSGGFVGNNTGTLIQNCYSTGVLFATSSSGVGGFIGENRNNRVSNCFWNIQDNNQFAGIGDDVVDSLYGKSKSEMRSKITYLDSGWDFWDEDDNGTEDIWYINEGRNTPKLWWQENHIPVVDAGENQIVYAFVDGYAEVQLDGSGSFDEDGDVLEYFWYNDANELIATGAEPNVLLPVGEHVIELIVNDGIEDSEPNGCVVTVIEAMETTAKMMPQMLNRKNNQPQVMGRIEFAGEDMPELDPNQPMLLVTGQVGIEDVRKRLVYSEEETAWYLVGFFDRAALIEAITEDGDMEMVFATKLISGQWVYGSDVVTVK